MASACKGHPATGTGLTRLACCVCTRAHVQVRHAAVCAGATVASAGQLCAAATRRTSWRECDLQASMHSMHASILTWIIVRWTLLVYRPFHSVAKCKTSSSCNETLLSWGRVRCSATGLTARYNNVVSAGAILHANLRAYKTQLC